MAGTATPIFPQTVSNFMLNIIRASGVTVYPMVTGTANGIKIESFNVASTNTGNVDLNIYLTSGSTNYYLTTITVSSQAGSLSTVPAVDVLRHPNVPSLAYDNNGNKYLYLASGIGLSVGLTISTATGLAVFPIAQGGQF